MYVRFPTYAPLLLVLVIATPACDGVAVSPTSPTPTAELSLTAEPGSVRPEFLHGSACLGRLPFGFGLTIIIGSGADVILRGLRFEFIDRFGDRSLPEVNTLPAPGVSTSIPTSSPVPVPGVAALPGTSSIPIPGSSPVHGLFVAGETSRPLPFFLAFGCGILPEGTLVIVADTTDASGAARRSQMRVAVSR